MDFHDTLFLTCLIIAPVCMMAGICCYKKSPRASLIFFALALPIQGGLFLQREKSAELNLASQEKLPRKSQWQVISQVEIPEGYVAAIIQNVQSQKVAAVRLDQKAPQ